jgi:hypothetical protein
MKTLKHLLTTLAWIMSAAFAGAATVTWDGGGGNLHWTNALNWSGNVLPGPGDDVVIGPGVETVSFSGATTTVSKLTCSSPLSVTTGQLSATSVFTLGAGSGLTVTGNDAQFFALGEVIVSANLRAYDGGAS